MHAEIRHVMLPWPMVADRNVRQLSLTAIIPLYQMQPTASIPKCENLANETLDSQDAHLPCVSFRMPSTPGSFTHANLPKPKHHGTSSETSRGSPFADSSSMWSESQGDDLPVAGAVAMGGLPRLQSCFGAMQWPHTQSSSALQAPSSIMQLQPLQTHLTRSQHQPRPLTGLLASLCLGLCFGLALSLCWPANG